MQGWFDTYEVMNVIAYTWNLRFMRNDMISHAEKAFEYHHFIIEVLKKLGVALF